MYAYDCFVLLLTIHLMACRAIPMIAFPRVQTIYMFVPLTRICVVYVVKEVTSFPGA